MVFDYTALILLLIGMLLSVFTEKHIVICIIKDVILCTILVPTSFWSITNSFGETFILGIFAIIVTVICFILSFIEIWKYKEIYNHENN